MANYSPCKCMQMHSHQLIQGHRYSWKCALLNKEYKGVVAILLRLTVHARHSLVLGLISFCDKKTSGSWIIHDPSFIYLFSKVPQFLLLWFAGIFSVLRNYLVRYSRFLVGFLDNGQILSLHNDSWASWEQRDTLFFVLKETNCYFFPWRSF